MNTRLYLCLATLLVAAGSAEGYWYGPYGPPGGTPGYGPPGYYGGDYPAPQSIRIAKDRSEQGYVVTISLVGYQPSDLEVVRSGRWLVVQRRAADQDVQQQPGAYSFQRSYSSLSRRLTLPRDADLEATQREDGDGFIRLTIPRQAR